MRNLTESIRKRGNQREWTEADRWTLQFERSKSRKYKTRTWRCSEEYSGRNLLCLSNKVIRNLWRRRGLVIGFHRRASLCWRIGIDQSWYWEVYFRLKMLIWISFFIFCLGVFSRIWAGFSEVWDFHKCSTLEFVFTDVLFGMNLFLHSFLSFALRYYLLRSHFSFHLEWHSDKRAIWLH